MKKILIVRKTDGLGDILMHRMMFYDFHRLDPSVHITFACLKKYHDAAQGHPYIEEVVDCDTVNPSKYDAAYNTSACCKRYELSKLPGKHRSDIWAEHCGVTLTKHDMHLPFIADDIMRMGRDEIAEEGATADPWVLFTPYASEPVRCLPDDMIEKVVVHLRSMGCFVYTTHVRKMEIFKKLQVPVLTGDIALWSSYVHAADYVVTVDTSVFHYAGGIGLPMTGIFTYADGKVFGKYFDFVLVQKHRDDGDWPCGPCSNWRCCVHPDRVGSELSPKPCLTKLSFEEVRAGIDEMFRRWPTEKLLSNINTKYATAYPS